MLIEELINENKRLNLQLNNLYENIAALQAVSVQTVEANWKDLDQQSPATKKAVARGMIAEMQCMGAFADEDFALRGQAVVEECKEQLIKKLVEYIKRSVLVFDQYREQQYSKTVLKARIIVGRID